MLLTSLQNNNLTYNLNGFKASTDQRRFTEVLKLVKQKYKNNVWLLSNIPTAKHKSNPSLANTFNCDEQNQDILQSFPNPVRPIVSSTPTSKSLLHLFKHFALHLYSKVSSLYLHLTPYQSHPFLCFLKSSIGLFLLHSTRSWLLNVVSKNNS